MSEHCTLVGILDDGWAGLSDAARQRLATAGLVIGAGRTPARLEHHLPGSASVRPMDGPLAQVPAWTAQA
ncbi:MAG: cobalamin biosynthesis bifunctional protein CbiET, partial [Proteobacteria bacterium]